MPLRQTCCIRLLESGDMATVLAIQSACYPAHLIESEETFLAKHRYSPDSCWMAEHNGSPQGYLFAHPWSGPIPPALNTTLTGIPGDADTLFLHDLAILPDARGRGIALALIQQALSWAKTQRYRKAMLVAIKGSQVFWQRHGFICPAETALASQEKLQVYGDGAACLTTSI